MISTLAILFVIFALVRGQGFGYSNFPNYAFSGGLDASQGVRDPRQNRGPVLFPQAPDNGQSSGVIVGASGYGFVPPSRGGRANSFY